MKTLKQILMVATVLLISTAAWATNVTLKVIDSGGNPISGVNISIHKSNCCGIPSITTDINGEATVDLANYSFNSAGYVFTAALAYSRASYAQSISNADEGNTIHTFQTSEARIEATDCNGAALSGVAITYFISNSGGGTVGTTGATGIVTKELFAGTYSFKAVINKTRKSVNVDISGSGVDHTFSPAQVNLGYPGTITVWQSNIGGITVTPGTYMFPGTYNFNFGGVYTAALTVEDCSGTALDGDVNILRVLDHNGNPIAGASARGGKGSNFGSWHVSGTTDANGYLLDIAKYAATTYSYEAKVNQTTAHTLPLSTGYFEFQTQLVTMRAEKCDGTPIAGGHVRWGNGSSFGTYHFGGGNTAANGESYMEIFPGTYSYEMEVNRTKQVKGSWNFPGDGTTVTWKTTTVTLNHSGSISYGTSNPNSYWFIKPSMEMLPGGTYSFNFRPSSIVNITIPDCSNGSLVLSGANIRLIDSQSNGIAGAYAKYYKSGWHVAGTTDANGNVFALVNGAPGNVKFRITHAGLSNEKWQNMSTNPMVVFQTKLVTFDLVTSTSATITGATTKYYGSGWKTFGSGTTSTSMELLPANTKFRVTHAGLSNEKWQNTGTNNAVLFATNLVTFDLETSTNAAITGATTKYYGSGWKTFGSGTTSTSMELLPANTKFRVTHGGLSNEKWQNTGSNSAVLFATKLVTFDLETSTGAAITGATTKYYGSGWKVFGSGTTSTTMELLPANTKFRVTHAGLSNEKWQNTGVDENVLFNTVLVTFDLDDSNGDPLIGLTKYYGSGWKTFGSGSTSTSMELLANNTKFRVGYGGLSNEKWQNTNSGNTSVVFATRLVRVEAHTGAPSPAGTFTWKYYGSGWNTTWTGSLPATTYSYWYLNREILPGNVKYRVETPCGTAEAWSSANVVALYPCGFSKNSDNNGFSVEDMATGIVEAEVINSKVYPNPFSDMATFSFELEESSIVKIVVFDLAGKIVKTVANGEYPQGTTEIQWNGTNDAGTTVAGGVYFYRIEAGNSVTTNRIIFTR